jgi:hypothetical protein
VLISYPVIVQTAGGQDKRGPPKGDLCPPPLDCRKTVATLSFFSVAEEEGGPLLIFGVGAPVDCCHCLTEILYLYIDYL